MIAVDTSTLIAFFQDAPGPDVAALDRAIELGHLILPPLVVTEILSDPKLDRHVARLVKSIPTLERQAGYWERAGATRATILAAGLRARIADTLIAQSCIDARVPLLTRDADFDHFSWHVGLMLG
ncbi:MAG TPA: PIN domain-containing protein [Candidatus Polarisedimenticolaceae bacterium]|nr:PIN domain-containing protein [Candidatus Polarisedimenticolaceae bacterium]